MTIKQQFKGKFAKCLTDLSSSNEEYVKCLLKLEDLEKEYESKYNKLLQGRLFVNIDNVLFLVKKVYLDTNHYNINDMPQVLTEVYVSDCLDGFTYKTDLLQATLTEWYEDRSGKKVVQEVKCDDFSKDMLCKIIKDSYENKIKLRKRKL